MSARPPALLREERERRRLMHPVDRLGANCVVKAGVLLGVDWTPVERARAIVADSRQTHVEWRDYFASHPDEDPGDLGDAMWHAECIENYDEVLAVLADSGDDR